MTTQQQNIIDSLVAEFNKINTPIPNGFARIGEALDKCDEWNCLVAGVTVSNAKFEYLREEMIETDYNRLKEECRLAGLHNINVTMVDDSIVIDIVGRCTEDRIKIYYQFERKHHSNHANKSIDEFKQIRIHSYQATSTYKDDFASIDSLFQHEVFFKNWTKLIEKSRK
ncbi:MAG: hypothetical protein ACK5DE_07710 [Bacteroidota bacterium]|jgi:hypothetical protein